MEAKGGDVEQEAATLRSLLCVSHPAILLLTGRRLQRISIGNAMDLVCAVVSHLLEADAIADELQERCRAVAQASSQLPDVCQDPPHRVHHVAFLAGSALAAETMEKAVRSIEWVSAYATLLGRTFG